MTLSGHKLTAYIGTQDSLTRAKTTLNDLAIDEI